MIDLDLVQNKLNEAHQRMLDEAFLGEEPVYPIQKAMDKLYQWNKENLNRKLNGSAPAKELEAAVQKVFGFKLVDIFWAEGSRTGPYTMMPYMWIYYDPNSSFAYGKNANGFYDKDHKLSVYICMNRSMMNEDTGFYLTSREAVAMLLHEIGHNFDYSPFRVSEAFYQMIINIVSFNFSTIGSDIVIHYTRPVITRLRELDTMIADILPPYRPAIRSLSGAVDRFIRTGNVVMSPFILPFILMNLAISPLYYILNLFGRKKERYADSFAATYGYGNDLTTGLDKFHNITSGVTDKALGELPIYKQLASLARAETELLNIAMGAHESNQKRAAAMIDKLKKDADDPNISPRMKAQLKVKIKDLENTYNAMAGMNSDQKKTLTTRIRMVVQNWYDGKTYFFVPSAGNDYAE